MEHVFDESLTEEEAVNVSFILINYRTKRNSALRFNNYSVYFSSLTVYM